MLAAEISNLLTEKGISTESVIEDYERIKSQAQTIGQLGVAKGIVDTYRDMLDMMPDKVTIEETTVSELTIEQLYSKTQHQKQLDSGKNDEHIRYATDKFEGEPGRSEAEQAGKADVRHNTEEEGRDQEESRGEEG